MKKRRLLWIAATLVLLLGAGYAVLWLTGPGHRINALSFERIQEGMTEKEVEEILGVPAGDYGTKAHPELTVLPLGDRKRWTSDDAQIVVDFDKRGLVVLKRLGFVRVGESIWQKLRRWLRIN
ncbi:MAG: hypothetical protein L0215_01380 [Gemmataceae bacterium]|nr:hypothetical protein [Gemmataceae bacterium]